MREESYIFSLLILPLHISSKQSFGLCNKKVKRLASGGVVYFSYKFNNSNIDNDLYQNAQAFINRWNAFSAKTSNEIREQNIALKNEILCFDDFFTIFICKKKSVKY